MYFYIYRIDLLDGSGRYYIGQRGSRVEPLKDREYKGSGVRLRNLYRRHGGYRVVKEGEYYTKTILQECNNQEELNVAERQWIGDLYRTDPLCLNLCEGGGTTSGFHHKESTRKLLSEQKKGKPRGPLSEETKVKLRKPRSEETKKRMSLAAKGKPKSKEACKHMSDAWVERRKRGVSEETRKKISEIQKGKPHPWNKGRIIKKYLYRFPDGSLQERTPNVAGRLMNRGIRLERV